MYDYTAFQGGQELSPFLAVVLICFSSKHIPNNYHWNNFEHNCGTTLQTIFGTILRTILGAIMGNDFEEDLGTIFQEDFVEDFVNILKTN